MQEDRNLFNQDFKAEPAWSISCRHRESGPKAFPNFYRWITLANSTKEKFPEIHLSGGVGILQSWDISLTPSLADSRFVVLCVPFLTNSQAIKLVVIRQRLFGYASQVVNYISCQPTGVREIDVIASLGPRLFSFIIKMEQQSERS